MYQPSDYQENRQQLRARLLALGLPAFALLACTIVSFALRWPQYITVGLSILLCGLCVFGYSMILWPVIAYGRHLNHALAGRTRTLHGAFIGMEQDVISREGIALYPMILNVGDKDKDEDDRLFYYDANLPKPPWAEGDHLAITSYDKIVTAWERE